MIQQQDRFAAFGNKWRVLSRAPDFRGRDVEGKEVSLSRYTGQKVVVLEFGAIT